MNRAITMDTFRKQGQALITALVASLVVVTVSAVGSRAVAEPSKPLSTCLPETPLPAGELHRILMLQSANKVSDAPWRPSAWYGTWHAADELCHTLLVLSVEGATADVIYSYGRGTYPPAFERHKATIARDGALRFNTSWGASLVYTRKQGSATSILATYTDTTGRWTIELRRIDNVK